MSAGASAPPITWEGQYDPAVSYLPRQLVTSGTDVFMAVAKTLGHTPSTAEVTPWLPLGGTPAVGVQSTVGAGLPSFTGRVAGDFHYDSTGLREHVLTGVAGSGAGSDDFTGTTGATLNGRSLLTGGGTWALTGSGTIQSDKGSLTSTNAAISLNVGATCTHVEATCIVPLGSQAGIGFRSTSATDLRGTAGYWVDVQNGGAYTIFRNGGTFTPTSGTRTGTVAGSGTYVLEQDITAAGLWSVKINGVVVCTYLDPSPLTGAFGGLQNASGGFTFDNWLYANFGTLAWAWVGGTDAVNVVAASGAAVSLPDVNVATMHRVTLTANCTVTFPSPVAGKSFALTLVQDGTGSRTVTWPGSVVWPGGIAPALTTGAGKADVLSFMADDGGVWRGAALGLNY